MFRIFTENKGSVTVLLTLLLVPFMIFSGIAADYAKIQGARTIIEGAQDLTANAALADFNTKLEQEYGLFAMDTDTDKLAEALKPYFLNTINSARLLSEQDDSYTQAFINSLFSTEAESYDNLISLNNIELTAVGLDGSQLSDPTVLKHQLVEFMKYRGPVALGVGFVEKLKVLSEIPKQKKVIEKKVEYEKKLDTVQDACKAAYEAIVQYEDTLTDDIKAAKDRLKEFMGELDEKHLNAILLLVFCSDSDDQDLDDMNKLNTLIQEDPYKSAYENEAVPKKDELLKYTQQALEENDWTRLSNFLSAKTSVVNGINFDNLTAEQISSVMDLKEEYEKNYKNSVLKIQALYYYGSKEYLERTQKEAEEQKKAEQEKKDDEEEETTTEPSEEEKKKAADKQQESEDWEKITFWYVNEFSTSVENFTSSVNSFQHQAADKISDLIQQPWQKIYLQYTDVTAAQSSLSNAIAQMDVLLGKINEIDGARAEWKSSIDNLTDSDIKQNMSSNYETSAQKLDAAKVQELKTILTNSSKYFDSVLSETGKISFYDYKPSATSVITTEELKARYKELNGTVEEDEKVDVEARSKNQEQYYKNTDFSSVTESWEDHQENEFYKYLKNLVNATTEKTESPKKDDAKAAKKKMTSEAAKKPTVENISGSVSGSNLPSDSVGGGTLTPSQQTNVEDSDDHKKMASSGLAAMGNVDLLSALNGIGDRLEELRDRLYVMEYCMNMFSCYTTNDGKDSGDAKTLTGKEISKETRKDTYRGELEYIAWGNKSIQNSVQNNFLTIYAIRAVLDVVYAFTDTELNSFALAVATALVGWTGFAVPIVKTAIILAAGLAEAALDLGELILGKDVPLFKTASNWRMKPSGLAAGSIEIAVLGAERVADSVVDNIYDKINELYDKNADKLQEELGKFYDQTAENINEAAVNSIITPIQNLITQNIAVVDLSGFDIDQEIDNLFTQIQGDCSDGSLVSQAKLQIINQCKGTIKSKAVSVYNEYAEKFKNSEAVGDEFAKSLNSMTQELTGSMKNAIKGTTNSMIASSKEQVKAWANESSVEAQKKISEELDRFSASVSKGAKEGEADAGTLTSAKSFTMNYEEYTQVFVLISLMANEDKTVARIGDLIQMNTGVTLADRYTILKLSSKNEVKTLFLAQDWESFFGMNLTEQYVNVNAELIRGY